eukprot:g3111.t1
MFWYLNFGGGGILGVLISWVVNCTLAEISVSKFFSLYFGILFCAIGLIVGVRVFRSPVPSDKRNVLVFFAAMVIFSGILCIVLDEQWFKFAAVYKVPLYIIVGMSVCFAFTFSLLDLLNYGLAYFQGEDSKALIESSSQVHLVLVSSLAMGAAFGAIFGLLDVEDRGPDIRNALIHEENYCIPIGFLIGSVSGATNYSYRKRSREVAGFKYGSSPMDAI